MRSSDEYNHLLKARGIPLPELGIDDIALGRVDALLAVEFLRKASIPILGGDVYLKRDNKVEYAYANWHTDPDEGENPDSYFERSLLRTESYVRSFPQPSEGEPIFSLVVDK